MLCTCKIINNNYTNLQKFDLILTRDIIKKIHPKINKKPPKGVIKPILDKEIPNTSSNTKRYIDPEKRAIPATKR